MAKADSDSTTFNLSRRGLVIGAAVLPAITIPAVAELRSPAKSGAARRELSVSYRTTPSRLRSGRRKNPRLGEKRGFRVVANQRGTRTQPAAAMFVPAACQINGVAEIAHSWGELAPHSAVGLLLDRRGPRNMRPSNSVSQGSS